MKLEAALLKVGNFYLNENMPAMYLGEVDHFEFKVINSKARKCKTLLAFPYNHLGNIVTRFIPKEADTAFSSDLTKLIPVWEILDFEPVFNVDSRGVWTCECKNEFGRVQATSKSPDKAACISTAKLIQEFKENTEI